MGTKCFSRRADQLWMRRAASSLPVPVSPVISTGMEVRAAWASCERMPLAASLSTTKGGFSAGSGISTDSSRRRDRSRAEAPSAASETTS